MLLPLAPISYPFLGLLLFIQKTIRFVSNFIIVGTCWYSFFFSFWLLFSSPHSRALLDGALVPCHFHHRFIKQVLCWISAPCHIWMATGMGWDPVWKAKSLLHHMSSSRFPCGRNRMPLLLLLGLIPKTFAAPPPLLVATQSPSIGHLKSVLWGQIWCVSHTQFRMDRGEGGESLNCLFLSLVLL